MVLELLNNLLGVTDEGRGVVIECLEDVIKNANDIVTAVEEELASIVKDTVGGITA